MWVDCTGLFIKANVLYYFKLYKYVYENIFTVSKRLGRKEGLEKVLDWKLWNREEDKAALRIFFLLVPRDAYSP